MRQCVFIVLVVLFVSACAEKPQVILNKRPPLYETSHQATSKKASPAKALVSVGIDQLQKQKLDQAEWSFEEAIQIDPDYGPAYYWLARVYYRLEQSTQIPGLLEKAEELLAGSHIWLERIAKFREFLKSR